MVDLRGRTCSCTCNLNAKGRGLAAALQRGRPAPPRAVVGIERDDINGTFYFNGLGGSNSVLRKSPVTAGIPLRWAEYDLLLPIVCIDEIRPDRVNDDGVRLLPDPGRDHGSDHRDCRRK